MGEAPEKCPFCGCDPFHYENNGLGMERVAVNCCDHGVELFSSKDECDPIHDIAAICRAMRDRIAKLEDGADQEAAHERGELSKLFLDGEIFYVPLAVGDEVANAWSARNEARREVESQSAEIARLREALRDANRTLCRAHGRIHCLPRTSDTDLANAIETHRAKYADAYKSAALSEGK